jgi:hypothetical protein
VASCRVTFTFTFTLKNSTHTLQTIFLFWDVFQLGLLHIQ